MVRLVRQPCGSLQVLEVPPLSKSSSVAALMMHRRLSSEIAVLQQTLLAEF